MRGVLLDSDARVCQITRSLGILAMALGVWPSSPASAEPGFLVASASETVDTRFDAQTMLLELGSGTSLSFFLQQNAQIAIFFTVSCGVFTSADDITFVDVDILVDSVAVPPTDLGDVFCTSGNAMSNAARDAVVTLAPGPHTVEVSARLVAFTVGESWRIDNKSLVLVVQEMP